MMKLMMNGYMKTLMVQMIHLKAKKFKKQNKKSNRLEMITIFATVATKNSLQISSHYWALVTFNAQMHNANETT